MPQLLVRQLPPEVHRALKARARQENKSAEAVAREILRGSLLPQASLGFGHRLSAIWEGAELSDAYIAGERVPHEPQDFS